MPITPIQEIVATVPARPSFSKSFKIQEEHYLWRGTNQTGCKPGSLCQTKAGDILAVWYGGGEFAGDESEETALWFSRYKEGKWEAPVCLYKEAGYHIWNPVFFALPSGKVQLYFRKFMPKASEPQREKYGIRDFTYHLMESDDNGVTWSTPQLVAAGPLKSPPIKLEDGTWIMPCGASGSTFLQLSKDEGKSWQKVGPIVREDGKEMMTEPSLVKSSDGKVLIFLRNRQKEASDRYCLRATFSIASQKLSPAKPTTMPNPDAGIDVLRLQDGTLVMATNPSQFDRSPLALYTSCDEGKSWELAHVLETGPGAFAQPSIIQSVDGKLHVLYYWWPANMPNKNMKHVIIELNLSF